nr:MAG TPA: hypothetical protein [Caudoviricetes sp.]
MPSTKANLHPHKLAILIKSCPLKLSRAYLLVTP